MVRWTGVRFSCVVSVDSDTCVRGLDSVDGRPRVDIVAVVVESIVEIAESVDVWLTMPKVFLAFLAFAFVLVVLLEL